MRGKDILVLAKNMEAEVDSEDSDKPSILPILRIAGNSGTKQQRREKEKIKKIEKEKRGKNVISENSGHARKTERLKSNC